MLFNEIATTREIRYIEINLTSSDNTYAPEGPVFVDIPSSYIQALGCDWSQMRLEDQDGNPITFWPDANGASEVYPGYYSIWFKTEVPATGSKTFRLYCDPKSPTYTSNPTDVIDFYCDCSSLDQLYSHGDHATVDQNKYVDPPASINVYPALTADKNTNGWAEFRPPYMCKFVYKINFSMVSAGAGYFLYVWFSDGTNTYLSSPLVWYGNSGVESYGLDYGYAPNFSSPIGQYDADGKWHRIIVVADCNQFKFDLYYDGQKTGSDLPFHDNTQSWDPSYTYSYNFIANSEWAHNTSDPNTSDPHIDSVVMAKVQYSHAPNVSVSLNKTTDASCISRTLSLL